MNITIERKEPVKFDPLILEINDSWDLTMLISMCKKSIDFYEKEGLVDCVGWCWANAFLLELNKYKDSK